MYVGSVKIFHEKFMENFYTSYVHIYILLFYFTTHLVMTEARSKHRVLPLVFIVKNFESQGQIVCPVYAIITDKFKCRVGETLL